MNVISYEVAYFLPPVSSDLPRKGGFSVTRASLNEDTGPSPRCHLLPGHHHHHDDKHKDNLGDDRAGENEDNQGDADADADDDACCRERSL